MIMKLNDLVQKILDNFEDGLVKEHPTLRDRPELVEKMILEVKLNINGERYAVLQSGTFDGKYYTDNGSSRSTTLPQYQDHFVRDYNVEYDCKMTDGFLFSTAYVNVNLEKRYYPTVLEFVENFLKQPLFKEESVYYIVYKKKRYFLSPENIFKFRDYSIRRIVTFGKVVSDPMERTYRTILQNRLFVKK